MERHQVAGFKDIRRRIWEGMTIKELYQVKNQRLEMQDSGIRVNQKDLDEINAELRKRGENV